MIAGLGFTLRDMACARLAVLCGIIVIIRKAHFIHPLFSFRRVISEIAQTRLVKRRVREPVRVVGSIIVA